MSAVIQFLEKMASNASFGRSAMEYQAAVTQLKIDDVQQKALLSHDLEGLSRSLVGRTTMTCLIWVPDEDVPAKENENFNEAISINS
jgi:hypothetical protein